MFQTVFRATSALALLACCATAFAAPDGWHASLDDGIAAARKSGKPILVVTGWKPGV